MRHKTRRLLWLLAALLILTLGVGCGKTAAEVTETPTESEAVTDPAEGTDEAAPDVEVDEADDPLSDIDPDAAGEDLELLNPEEAAEADQSAADAAGEELPEPVSDPEEGTTLYEEGPPPAGYEESGEVAEDQSGATVNGVDTSAVDAAVPLTVEEDGTYTSKEEVALYIHTYGKLPSNFITKKKAEQLGWKSTSYDLDEVAPGKSIGGSYFGNYEGILPDGDYRECDIDYHGGSSRGPKRIVYSSDGRIYYTDDHYETFEQLY